MTISQESYAWFPVSERNFQFAVRPINSALAGNTKNIVRYFSEQLSEESSYSFTYYNKNVYKTILLNVLSRWYTFSHETAVKYCLVNIEIGNLFILEKLLFLFIAASDAERSEASLTVESLLLRSHTMVTRNNGYLA